MGQLAEASGYKIDWSVIGQADMIRASIEAYNGGSSGLAKLIRAGISKRL